MFAAGAVPIQRWDMLYDKLYVFPIPVLCTQPRSDTNAQWL
jgi:hypothetical protein